MKSPFTPSSKIHSKRTVGIRIAVHFIVMDLVHSVSVWIIFFLGSSLITVLEFAGPEKWSARSASEQQQMKRLWFHLSGWLGARSKWPSSPRGRYEITLTVLHTACVSTVYFWETRILAEYKVKSNIKFIDKIQRQCDLYTKQKVIHEKTTNLNIWWQTF